LTITEKKDMHSITKKKGYAQRIVFVLRFGKL
jgi:hypothetical protein